MEPSIINTKSITASSHPEKHRNTSNTGGAICVDMSITYDFCQLWSLARVHILHFQVIFWKKYKTTGSSCPFLEILYRMIVVQYVEALNFLPSFGVGSSSGSHTLRLSVDANVFSANTVGALKYWWFNSLGGEDIPFNSSSLIKSTTQQHKKFYLKTRNDM